LPYRHITFIVAKKLNLQFILLFYGIFGEGVVENIIWGRGLAENVRIPSYRGRGSKITQKTVM